MLGFIGDIPLWLVIVIVGRDVLILVGYAIIYFLVEERLEVKPTRVGKWSTTFQLLTLAVALVMLHDPRLLSPTVLDVFVVVTTVVTIFSGCQYLYKGLVWLQTRAPSISRP
jgi:cardiolipin synthase